MASGECLCLLSGQILFLFVCSLRTIDTSVIDMSRDEDDDSFEDDRKLPATKSSPKQKEAKPVANFYSPEKTLSPARCIS